jgi:hypothetical protein
MKMPISLLAAVSLASFNATVGVAEQPGPFDGKAAVAPEADAIAEDPKRLAGTVARPKDGIRHPDLDKAWVAYDAVISKAAETIRAAIVKRFDVVTAEGDLDAAEKWHKVQEDFDNFGVTPAEKDTESDVVAAMTDCRNAEQELAKAYETVVRSLTIERNLPKARAAKDEWQASIARKHNLLLDCDLGKDVVSGRWVRTANGLQSDDSAPAKIKIPFQGKLPEQYDFEIQFTPQRGDLTVGQFLSAFGTGFACDFGGWGNKVVAFQLVDGRTGDNNRSTTRRPAWLAAGRRHVTIIQVRRNSVAAILNGQHVVTLPTDYRNLRHRSDWAIPVDSVGIGSWGTPTLFHSAAVIPK